jgi:hypothetical protein
VIIVECYRDQALVYRMGFIPDEVRHAHNKSRVLATLEEIQKAIGVVDEDPWAGRSKYLKDYDAKENVGNIKLLIRRGETEKMVIQISPRLEDWLYKVAKRNRISPENFGLPDTPGELHSASPQRDKGSFRRFLIAVNRSKDEEINTFKRWIREAIE